MIDPVMMAAVVGLALGQAAAPATTSAVREEAKPSASVPMFGATLLAGVPDGAGVQVVVRPLQWLRLGVGATHNGMGLGVAGGVTFVPFNWVVAPTLSADLGKVFPGDSSWLLGGSQPLLAQLEYSYANAQLGVEIGSQRRFVFFLRAGLSYLQLPVNGVEAMLESNDLPIEIKGAQINGTIPSVKTGFTIYFG